LKNSATSLKIAILLLLAGGFSFLTVLRCSAEPSAVLQISADRLEVGRQGLRAEGRVVLRHPACRGEAGVLEISPQDRIAWMSADAVVALENTWASGGRIGVEWARRSGAPVRLLDPLGRFPGGRAALQVSRADDRFTGTP
jgi:hypothetical protein